MNRYLVIVRSWYCTMGSSFTLTSQVIESDKSIELLRGQIVMDNTTILVVQL